MKQKVIFVPGFTGSKRDMAVLKILFEEEFEIIYFGYDTSLKDSISKNAKKLNSFIEKLDLKPQEKVDIIGISAGGIIADYYLKSINSKKVRKFVSICSPYKGTPIANLVTLFTKKQGLMELQIGSPILKQLKRKNSPIGKENQKSIWSFFDFIVPGSSARNENPSHSFFFAHNVIQFWPPIILQIKKFLKNDETKKMRKMQKVHLKRELPIL